MENEIIKAGAQCCAGLGKVRAIIFFDKEPEMSDQKALDPITEDAEFEVIDKKHLELPPANA